MKTICTLIVTVAITFAANAQERGGSISLSGTPHLYTGTSKISVFPSSVSRAIGDTLMYMPLPGTIVNAADSAAFTVLTQDNDGLTPSYPGFATSFGDYYSTDSSIYGMSCSTCSTSHNANYYHPWETEATVGHVGTFDSSFFWCATSLFIPPGTADNWLEFGPITIPASGATLNWFDRFNRYRDGYSVLISNTFSSPLSFADFTAAPIYTLPDAPLPSPTYATDTTWLLKSVNIPNAYNGQKVTFAFHHTAHDMDILRLDEIFIVQAALSGIQEFVNGAKLFQNIPNPANSVSAINYELEKNAQVAFNVYDVTGKVVATESIGNQTSGAHALNFSTNKLSAGVYYYSLTVNSATTPCMKMVVIK